MVKTEDNELAKIKKKAAAKAIEVALTQGRFRLLSRRKANSMFARSWNPSAAGDGSRFSDNRGPQASIPALPHAIHPDISYMRGDLRSILAAATRDIVRNMTRTFQYQILTDNEKNI